MSPVDAAQFQHETVLLVEAVEAVLAGEGFYIDGTFGRGGHSRHLLSKVGPTSRLLVIDKDPLAIAEAQRLAAQDSRVTVVQDGFANLAQVVAEQGLTGQVCGVLLDLGVSSPQLDDARRGFSFQNDGPLDMRMNPDEGLSAAQWLTVVKEVDLANVLFQYGDERFSRRIAKAIVAARQEQALTSTTQLAEIIKVAHPKWDHKRHPATKSFQAIRIFINGELVELEQALNAAIEVLKPGGRLAVIAFHSLEDRAVKHFIRLQANGPELPPGLPIPESDIVRTMRAVGKAIKPSKDEVAVNVRSRSAVLRIAEKL
ncbi:16S rRNA (cytosine(1402)-N(4))-methyltransferase RsmH [Reinekea forsetii]|jgi:16S rRNA (cytosine1402-N4)-methyltransferase|uniref:Ribosomal RNA small subunit methyltransferase H n=1 Tax=Reinekea forsetii TaxID=1336806 RepID=A0A2K8KSW8_9GAMM|nr:16S rRNA (cytosine(1402)-N(4))-methyltransferase RsmH [Reinekea forsetii]ATX77803.1 rRNA small subunit methyltransferase H [Reinekea forsetii]MDO7643536.1 16S rRNA (cytosine(1402)-N(4))-methyltransferase RsmH [Reinekea forsetii]